LFKRRFRDSLDAVRRTHRKPIALLAVTEQKFAAMKAAEFGKVPEDDLSDAEVRERAGFDRFFGPDDFREHVEVNDGECGYLLYVRSSDPIERLKRPDVHVEHPLLGDPELRRIIKENALTMNIDAPEMEEGPRINDTKEYMIAMDMAYPIRAQEELLTREFIDFLGKGGDFPSYEGRRLTEGFAAYLERQGVDPYTTRTGELAIHAKPLKGTYGCYGHHAGKLNDRKFRTELRGELRGRGTYAIQHEMTVPTVHDSRSGDSYSFIDRLFFSTLGEVPVFMGGFRSLLPNDSAEVRAGRLHGNDMTVWAEIS
jgi:hypothetical protein